MSIAVLVIRRASKRIRGLLGDIADRAKYEHTRVERRLQEASDTLRHLRASYSALQDGVLMLGPDEAIEWCNAAAVRMLRLRYPQDVGQPLVNLMRNPEFGDYLHGGDFGSSFELRLTGAQTQVLDIQATLFSGNSKVLFVRDVTALRRLETMRQDFLANISHELRTPLTVISGYLDSLEELLHERPQSVARALAQMKLQASRMENLLRDLMLLTRLESSGQDDQGQSESIAVLPLLQALREAALVACDGERHIGIECAPQLVFHGERVALESVFSNLIFNAVKYTQDKGNVALRFAIASDGALFEVRDDGIGIDPMHIPRLTERFYRVDRSRSLERGGTGLGLAIVKHALIRLGGRLEIHSLPGKGSTFSCFFPLRCVSLDSCHQSVTKQS